MRKNTGAILIVGGYGQVGRLIAERLATLFPGRVIIAGRNVGKARAVAMAIKNGTTHRQLDILSADCGNALNGVSLVISCVDQGDTRFVSRCLAQGIHYVDISANRDFFSQVEQLDACAKRQQAMVMLSVGVAPGLSNMLAVQIMKEMERIERLDIVLEFGLGDRHGKAACEWILDNLNATYTVKENNQWKPVRSFGEFITLALWEQDVWRRAYRFNFPDQHTIGHRYDVPNVSTWLRFDNRVATWLFAALARMSPSSLLENHWVKLLAVWLFMHLRLGSDTCMVTARAQHSVRGIPTTRTLSLIGRQEALMTAIFTVKAVRCILEQSHESGVFHSFEVLTFHSILSTLKRELPDLVVHL